MHSRGVIAVGRNGSGTQCDLCTQGHCHSPPVMRLNWCVRASLCASLSAGRPLRVQHATQLTSITASDFDQRRIDQQIADWTSASDTPCASVLLERPLRRHVIPFPRCYRSWNLVGQLLTIMYRTSTPSVSRIRPPEEPRGECWIEKSKPSSPCPLVPSVPSVPSSLSATSQLFLLSCQTPAGTGYPLVVDLPCYPLLVSSACLPVRRARLLRVLSSTGPLWSS